MSGTRRPRWLRREQVGQSRTWRQLLAHVGHVRTGIIALFLVAAITAFALVLAAPSNASHQSASSAGDGNTPHWVQVPSNKPQDVREAARSSALYQQVLASAQTLLGQTLRDGTLGTPTLVRVYHPAPGMSDVWVVPVLKDAVPGLNTPGPHVVALLDFAYDAPNNRIRPLTFSGPFVASDPQFGKPFPQVDAAAAISAVARARGQLLAAGQQPELIYFPADFAKIAGPNASILWRGGGQFADFAMWRVPAADGHDYIVGINGTVYTADQLPFSPQASR